MKLYPKTKNQEVGKPAALSGRKTNPAGKATVNKQTPAGTLSLGSAPAPGAVFGALAEHPQPATAAGVLSSLDAHLGQTTGPRVPQSASFHHFLIEEARVRATDGSYHQYDFVGREALIEIVNTIDLILGSHTHEPLKDSQLAAAGGAQFGKTTLELYLLAYLSAVRARNVGLYLPDDDLVEGIVDSKLRPDVIEQLDWFAEMTQVGKALNKSGKAVNRKGALLVTDGKRSAMAMIRGLGKVPTTFSHDVAMLDEVDDIEPRMEKFVSGRMTASDLRFKFTTGTQRIHGRGMHAAWKAGSQGVMILTCPSCGKKHNPEEEFPGIVRLAVQASACPAANPILTYTGEFRSGDRTWEHDPANHYYLGCVDCGAELPRDQVKWEHRRPERIARRNWSFRICQLGIPAIDLNQIVAAWVEAVADAEKMAAFRCDRLALPQSTGQKLTPEIIARARGEFDLRGQVTPGCTGFAGLDMGDRCWYRAHERENAQPNTRRVLAVECIPAGNVVGRVLTLFTASHLSALFVDERPLVNEARTLALLLNGLDGVTHWPVPAKDAWIRFPSGLTWNGRLERWENLRCAVVRFTKHKLGAGVTHTWVEFTEDGRTKFVPCIECNRFETIDAAVRQYLTPAENVVETVNGAVRTMPSLWLPRRPLGAPAILETLENHLITGSEREKEADGSLGDYVDQAENHLLLADAYGNLAESACVRKDTQPFAYSSVTRRSRELSAHRANRRAIRA